ncbi:alpha-mannosidase [Paenibacillus mendelii]|uniref:Alpha-mannosidase n=1 Tax=Paenibacillus mendelii TaxID=206163 RepID=A0ABV6JAP1_9BACL|nr:alpha-mannosidase [Paenibacillus mendelii]MCQ6560762.1 alpha-mannosidase [Paenibacillus mendelii]
MARKTVHVISHTHWDREWYMPYEKHHVKLIALMDTLLETFDRDPEFHSFHLDGQTIILDDYLQVRPEQREKLVRYVQEGRLRIGPWYILQDEFLTSSEANVRNLLVGHKDARAFGPITKIGYFPDSFGNMGQAPQLIRQAGMDTAVFGRGVKPTGFNNSVSDSEAYESPYSELTWRAPDGSEVLGILFANWYHNGMEAPVDESAARAYWQNKLPDVERFASTPHLLFMNGCDHQPVQTDLSIALHQARELYPDYDFVHSNFEDYARSVTAAIDTPLAVVNGELRSQRTDGWSTLVNTASARVYIKQANAHVQTLLEKVAEPAAAIASLLGRSYPHHLFTYAWKTLMQNHPHDSICGCSVDEVHREMMSRFAKSQGVAETLVEDSLQAMLKQIDTTMFDSFEGAVPFAAANYSGWRRTGTVQVDLEVARKPLYEPSPSEIYAELEQMDIAGGYIVDHEGRTLTTAQIEDLGVKFNYSLPDDRFRQPYMARRVRVTLGVEDVPPLGYQTFAWVPASGDAAARMKAAILPGADEGNAATPRLLENEFIAVMVHDNGSLSMEIKATGQVYRDLCVYEDVGDIGNEYMFKQPEGDEALTTKGLTAEISLMAQTPSQTTVEIVHHWSLPADADALLQREMAAMVPLQARKSQRSTTMTPFVIRTQVTVQQGVRAVMVKTSFDNQASDHRLRALFPTDILAASHHADSIFEIAERPNIPSPEWRNPSNTQHQQSFVAVDEAKRGLAVANIGLNEYEVLRDNRGTIAVTLLRAVGELGDWGAFPTPEAQCIGEQSVQFALIPYDGSQQREKAAAEAYQFQIPWIAAQTDIHQGSLPPVHGWLNWEGDRLALSTVKIAEESQDLIVRWYNLSTEPTELIVQVSDDRTAWYASNIMEEQGEPLTAASDGLLRVNIKPAEIITLGRRFSE